MTPGAVKADEAGTAVRPVEGAGKWRVVLVVGTGMYLTSLGAGVVNVALPVLTLEFAAPLVQVQWVVLAFLLSVTGLLLPAGRLADMLGRKEVFLTGSTLFAVGSGLCGLAPTLGWLIAARAVQGAGAALVQANGRALVTQAFPAAERGTAQGVFGSFVQAGLLSGPVVGGLITEYAGWRWAFYANVAIGAVAIPAGWKLLRPSPAAAGQRFDLAGAALFVAAVGSLLLALNQGARLGWGHPVTLGLLATAALACAAFVAVEGRTAQPMVDLTLFRNRAFSGAALSCWLGFLASSGPVLLMPFYCTLILGLRVDEVGLVLAAAPATTLLLAPVGGTLADRFGTRSVAALGQALTVAGLVSLVFLPQGPAGGGALAEALRTAVSLGVVGAGQALFNAPNSAALFDAAPASRMGLVGGLWALTRNLGGAIGQATAGVLWSVVVLAAAGGEIATATQAPPEAMLTGFRTAFAWAACLSFAALLVWLSGQPGRSGTLRPA
ncbi:MAG TPA: DHA2 family efflux MFS transporter permease subunit [Chloroflexota bacterium]|nr:DHA2 family efflux MFS transporter permease subunit [Chloroflexota bacterium]